MAPADHLIAFAVATLIFAVLPGPALLYTVAQTLARGRAGGLLATLGLHIGGYAHVIAATVGLSALFRHVPELYWAVRLGGACYLVWLGIGILRRQVDPDALPLIGPKSPRKALMESVVVELLNPKTALFYIAFLPQFVSPAGAWPIWLQFFLLGATVNLSFSTADVIAALLTSSIMRRVRGGGRALRWARYAGGSVMIGLGLRLALVRD